MSVTMAKKKPAKPYNRHSQPREAFHLSQELRQALQAYRESLRPQPGKSEVIRVALEKYLASCGFWPPKE